jgi:hypothetical protein
MLVTAGDRGPSGIEPRYRFLLLVVVVFYLVWISMYSLRAHWEPLGTRVLDPRAAALGQDRDGGTALRI